MATNQTHHDIRHALTQQFAAMTAEKAAAAQANARYVAIGDPSIADGGLGSTNQLLDVVQGMQELLDATVGDPDYGNITPVFGGISPSSTVGSPVNIGTGGTGTSLTITVAHLLPAPMLELRPQPSGTAIPVEAFIQSTSWSKVTSPFTGVVGVASVGTIVLRGVSVAVASGPYKIAVKNPLDTRTAEVLSDTVYLTTT